MTTRSYTVSPWLAPGLPVPAAATQTGGVSFGALDAARQYAAAHLPGYDVIPHALEHAPGLWRVSAVNQAAQLGAVLWVREVERA